MARHSPKRLKSLIIRRSQMCTYTGIYTHDGAPLAAKIRVCFPLRRDEPRELRRRQRFRQMRRPGEPTGLRVACEIVSRRAGIILGRSRVIVSVGSSFRFERPERPYLLIPGGSTVSPELLPYSHPSAEVASLCWLSRLGMRISGPFLTSAASAFREFAMTRQFQYSRRLIGLQNSLGTTMHRRRTCKNRQGSLGYKPPATDVFVPTMAARRQRYPDRLRRPRWR